MSEATEKVCTTCGVRLSGSWVARGGFNFCGLNCDKWHEEHVEHVPSPSSGEARTDEEAISFLDSVKSDVRTGFLCGAWTIRTQFDGQYVMRCDRPEGHEQDHCDSVLLTNWKGPTPKEAKASSPAPLQSEGAERSAELDMPRMTFGESQKDFS